MCLAMRKSPITVQQWVESLPSPAGAPLQGFAPRKTLPREFSIQSDDANSLCSSVESVLENRKPDPEAVLLGLGFGPPRGSNLAARIPSRFLQPSGLISQMDIDKFLEQYGDAKYPEHSAPNSPAKSRPKTC